MYVIKDYADNFITLDKEQIQSYATAIYSELKALNETRRNKVIEYLRELNGASSIPEPEYDWQTTIKSSMFFQKVIFAFLYLRSLVDRSSKSLLTFSATNQQSLMPSILKKFYDYAVYKSEFFTALNNAIFYGIISGDLVLLIDADFEVDNWGDIEKKVIVKAINPLSFYRSNDDMFFAYEEYIPIEKAYRISRFWTDKPDTITPYNSTTSNEEVEYYVKSSSKRAYVKLTHIYCRYVDNTNVSQPIKLTLLNDNQLVDVIEINHADGNMPFVRTAFYTEDMQTSYTDMIWDYYKEDTRLIRSFIDRTLLSTSVGFEVDTSLLDSSDTDVELRPFMVLYKQSEGKLVDTFSLSSIDPNSLPFRQLILQEAQNITALTEFLMGLPTSKGRPTAKEVLLKTQMNQQIINTVINRLEDEFVAKAVRKMLTMYIQTNLRELLGLLTPEEQQEINTYMSKAVLENKPEFYFLVKELYKGITIKVEGLSGIVRQKDEMESLLSIIEMFGNLGAINFLNIPVILKRIVDIMQLPSEIIRIPTQEELVAMAQKQGKPEEIQQLIQQLELGGQEDE